MSCLKDCRAIPGCWSDSSMKRRLIPEKLRTACSPDSYQHPTRHNLVVTTLSFCQVSDGENMRHTFPLICALFLLAATGAAQHLPDTAIPEHYQITLAPDFGKENFVGDETLQIRVLKPTPSITLNALEITFQDALIAQNGVKQAAKVTTDVDKQQATLTVPKLLAAGTATIHIRYAGILNGDLRGFYLSKTE